MLLTTIVSSEAVDLGFVQLVYLKVIFLGIVQGITELLPISSTAHLRIVPSLLGWQDPGSVFSAAMQLASLGAVLAYFWQDIKSLAGSSIKAIAHQDYQSKSFRLTLGLLIGTIPIGIAGLLLKKTLNGIAQAFALIPGVSRSGSTLTAGLFLNMERETAARFSFLLGLPAIILAGAVELHSLTRTGLDLNGWLILGAGLTSASISAFLAIFGLLRYLEKRSTWFFVWYRLVMGLFLLIGSAMGFLR